MIDIREKLVELLKEGTGCTYGGSYGDVVIEEEIDISDEEIARIADHLLANGLTVQEWIPVTERLPEEEGFALIWHDEIEISLFTEGKFCFYDSVGCLREYVDVTHWMPLPSAPKGVSE